MLRRTPCVGICSTTYGDLVCRGCKRFAHEIVQWNGFDGEQRDAVWQRLLALRGGAVQTMLHVHDEARLRARARQLDVGGADELDAWNLAYEVLQRLQWRGPVCALEQLGMAPVGRDADTEPEPAALIIAIDREFYQRSLAQYERNYRIPPE
ncbi:MAG: DUF1289 domain-containing protein [Pseudomonadota bacterium]